jgi:BirA family biotin operon repressor/biotin-[acetyl-CoA-carboxylase] ligase
MVAGVTPASPHRSGPAGEATSLFANPQRLLEVDSTNRHLADLARQGAPEGTAVLADTQTAGRGRLGRRWVDVRGGSVLCSLLFRPPSHLAPERWHIVTWCVALAARDAVGESCGVALSFKWPNDLMAGDAKLGGILAEVIPPDGLVVGIGINCNWPPGEEAPPAATSLDRLVARPVDRSRIEESLLGHVAARYEPLVRGDGTSRAEAQRTLVRELRAELATIGRLVAVDTPDGSFTGRALDVGDDGLLLVDVGACIRPVAVGDVRHLRHLPQASAGTAPG